jgi:hypothetical protein
LEISGLKINCFHPEQRLERIHGKEISDRQIAATPNTVIKTDSGV